MTVLTAMRPEVFAAYLDSAVAAYAQDNIDAGRWPAEGALERSRADFEDSLPHGLATPDNYLFEIQDDEGGTTVGYLWFAVVVKHGLRSAYVYDLEVKSEYRRQGHAKRAFEALEARVVALGLSSIGLHVFGHNPGAQSLYSQLGYTVTGINMIKQLNKTG
jgi:ribosomal protein S18 acetylase RimI-like enzyme